VRDYYISKSPIKRGCLPSDVAKAVFYCVEQTFETGQAIPVSGGQVMLN
jgi:sorbitol-6-phosphate 2-dehydrogenase